MSESVNLTAEIREGRGSRAAHKIRKAGRTPAIVYGHKEENVAVSVDTKELYRAIVVQHARVLDLKVGSKVEKVLIRDLQWDHLGKHMLHVDLERVSADERVKVTIPVKLKNSPKSLSGGVLDQPLHQLHIECSPIAIPDDITIDITNLTLGNPIHVRELTVPTGVKVLEALEMVVVQIKLPGVEAATTTPAGEPVQPEVIKKEKKTEDDEE